MAELNGGQLAVRQLQHAGVDTLFGVVAGPMIEIFSGAVEAGLQVIGCRHEENAAFMASAWGYAKKKPGVVVAGSGPGMTNTVTPMHVATAVGVPVVAVFCATVPEQGYGPYTERAIVLGADLECRPCGRHGGQRCPRGTGDCMRLVDATEVVCALQRFETGVRQPGSGLH